MAINDHREASIIVSSPLPVEISPKVESRKRDCMRSNPPGTGATYRGRRPAACSSRRRPSTARSAVRYDADLVHLRKRRARMRRRGAVSVMTITRSASLAERGQYVELVGVGSERPCAASRRGAERAPGRKTGRTRRPRRRRCRTRAGAGRRRSRGVRASARRGHSRRGRPARRLEELGPLRARQTVDDDERADILDSGSEQRGSHVKGEGTDPAGARRKGREGRDTHGSARVLLSAGVSGVLALKPPGSLAGSRPCYPQPAPGPGCRSSGAQRFGRARPTPGPSTIDRDDLARERARLAKQTAERAAPVGRADDRLRGRVGDSTR